MDKAALAPLLKRIPQVQEVLKCECISSLEESLPHSLLSDCVRSEITALRASILAGENPEFDTESVAQGARSRTLAFMAPSLRRIINATGVVIHTNMGRSVMCPQAIEAVEDVIKGYSTCEYDTNKMQRGSRHNHYERLICAITGAEAAIAVNNNAAAVVLVLSEFAAGHEAIVSRGELIELGGSFRIPDIMDQSGATMVEVGTTNKTHPHDYERAITENTSMMLKIHKSNYQVIGFTKNVSLTELRDISNAHEKETGHKVLVFEDQGSGSFVDLERYGARKEPTVAQSLAEGADLVSFSGDKMLGGPQCGIVVGRKELIDRLKKNPLARVVRLDKMTLAALEGTLRCYLQGEEAINSIPTVRMLSEDADTVRVRADKLKAMIEERIESGKADIEVVPEISRAGGGSLPMYDIDTFAVAIKPVAGSTQECDKFLVQQCPVPIVARIAHDAVIVDPRTLLDEEEMEAVAEGLKNYFATV
ncbi:MAG: L-seryl-tRNA(Sec) selenium transferase [Coriobacteriaceae bacterium]|nr:L-seryl-tRNA(Sec) selenium transferase [Coriobacteriaceae bacterium]